MKPDIQKTGENLKVWWRRSFDWKEAVARHDDFMSRPENAFGRAMVLYLGGDPSEMADYLISDRELGADDRAWLAHNLAAPIPDDTKGAHRPRNEFNRAAADTAIQFYKEWRALNRRLGVNDRGHAKEMKDEALDFIIRKANARISERTQDRIRDLMDERKDRRK